MGDRGIEHAVSQADVAVDGRLEVGLGGNGGEVNDGVRAVHQLGQLARVARQIGDNDVVTPGHDVDAAHVVAGGNEPGHQTLSDTPRRPGDHNAHVIMLHGRSP